MNYVITTQITENYYESTKSLFGSIKKYWKGRFVVGFIDFIPKDYIGEYYYMKRKEIYTYRTDYPKNRIDFVCPQGGEFIDQLECSNDDIIIQIDADSIMQREMTTEELNVLKPGENEFISVYGANPPNNLYQVTLNLGMTDPNKFMALKEVPEFTPSFLVGNPASFLKLKNNIIAEWDGFVKYNSHHAGIQWLISKIVHEKMKIRIVDNRFQCGDWYQGFDLSIVNHRLCVDNKIVIFNHTKFIDKLYLDNIFPKPSVKKLPSTPTWNIELNV